VPVLYTDEQANAVCFVLANIRRQDTAQYNILLMGRRGPQRCETSRLPQLLDNPLTDGDENLVTSSGIERMNFWLEAECLN
jgi:hypothetical protein